MKPKKSKRARDILAAQQPDLADRARAYHESGHAAMAFILDLKVELIRIPVDSQREDDDVHVEFVLPAKCPSRSDDMALVGYSGRIAEYVGTGRHADLEIASRSHFVGLSRGDLALVLGKCERKHSMTILEWFAYKDYLFHKAYRLMTQARVWDGVSRLVQHLLDLRTLSGKEAGDIWAKRGTDSYRLHDAERLTLEVRPSWAANPSGDGRDSIATG